MSIPTVKTSQRLRKAAAAELDRINPALADLDAKIAALASEMDTLITHREDLRSTKRSLARLAGDPDPQPAQHKDVLQGKDVRRAAVIVHRTRALGTSPVHYRDWYEMTTQDVAIAGANPLATFLTQIRRLPGLRALGSGTYAYDPDLIDNDYRRLADLDRQLATLDTQIAACDDPHECSAARRKRDAIRALISPVERRVEESRIWQGTDPASTTTPEQGATT